jgi:hypothetical protein
MSEDGSQSMSIKRSKSRDKNLDRHKLFVTNLDGTVKVTTKLGKLKRSIKLTPKYF